MACLRCAKMLLPHAPTCSVYAMHIQYFSPLPCLSLMSQYKHLRTAIPLSKC